MLDGLRVMSDLEQLERERRNAEYMEVETVKNSMRIQSHTAGARTASNEMCTFLVMNISSL